MKRLYKITALFFAVCIAAAPIFAIDGGGSIAAGIDVQLPIKLPTSPISVKNFERLEFYLQQNMDKAGNYNFYLDTSYLFLFSGDFSKSSKKTFIKNIVDIDQLNFSFLFPLSNQKNLSFIFGRFPVVDYTNTILKQKIDGAKVGLDFQTWQANFTLGYTGLLNTYTNPLYAVPMKYSNPVYVLSPAFITMNADANFYVGKYSHRLGFEFMSFFQPKLNPGYQLYFTAFAGGQIIPRLVFDLSTTLTVRKFRTNTRTQVGGLLVGNLTYYFKPLNASVGFRALYASGANPSNGEGSFVGFSRLPLSKISGIVPSDVFSFGLSGTLKPIEDLHLKFTTDLYLKGSKPTTGEKVFSGFQWGFNLDYILMQSFYLNFELGHFIGEKGQGAFLGSLKLMLTF